jgi:cytochrome P450
LRTATEAVTFGDFQVHEGEYVCVLLKQACRDPRAFPDAPDAFREGRDLSRMLHFGPEGGPHHCLGRELSRELFAEMLLGLKDLPGLHAHGKVENVLGFNQLKVKWNRTEQMTRSYGPHRSSGGDNG